MNKFFKSLIDENPLFILCLGMCPALAVTTTFENGYLMGLSVLLVLIFSNIIISLISKFIDHDIRIPAYIIIIATLVTFLELTINTYIEPLSRSLGIYIPLITVNCIVLGRAIAYASRHKVGSSIMDALKMGLGYTIALSLIGLIRELFGNNTITIMDKISHLTGYIMKYNIFPANDFLPNTLLLTPAGAFLTLGLTLGIVNFIRKKSVK